MSFGLMAILAHRLGQSDIGFSAGHLAVLRFGVGVVFSLVLFRFRPGLFRPSNIRLLILRGVSGGFVVLLYFHALARIPAGQAGILYNLFPVFATLLSLVLLRERPSVHLFLALAAATLGVILVLGQGGHVGFHLGMGEMAALGAAGFAAVSANLIRAARPTDNSATIFFFFCLAGMPVVLPFAFDPWPTASGPWLLALLTALLALVGQLLMADAYGALSVAEAAVWLQLMPVAQYVLAIPLLGERSTSVGGFGVLLSVAGVAYGTLLGNRRRPA